MTGIRRNFKLSSMLLTARVIIEQVSLLVWLHMAIWGKYLVP